MTCSMLKAGLDGTYESDPGKDFLIAKCLQFADSSLLLQCWESIRVPICVCIVGAGKRIKLIKCGGASD